MQNQISERARKLGSNSVKKTERNTSHEWDGGAAPKLPPCRGQKDPVRRFQLPLLKPISHRQTTHIASLEPVADPGGNNMRVSLGWGRRPQTPALPGAEGSCSQISTPPFETDQRTRHSQPV